MAKVSFYKIAEQARITLKGLSLQVLIEDVKNAYAYIAKKQWYENTAFDETAINGSFVYTFVDQAPLLDISRDIYYIIMPSSYLELPHEMGVVWVSGMKDKKSWVRVSNWGIFQGIQASVMGGRMPYEIEGNKMMFPKMTAESAKPVLLKLAIALDAIDPEEELNIAPNIVTDIISLVIQRYNPGKNDK